MYPGNFTLRKALLEIRTLLYFRGPFGGTSGGDLLRGLSFEGEQFSRERKKKDFAVFFSNFKTLLLTVVDKPPLSPCRYR